MSNCASLKKQLESYKMSLFNNNAEYSESLNELSNSIDYINAQYDESNDMQTNQELIVKFADRYFKGIAKLLNICKKIINNSSYEKKNDFEIQFKDPVLKLINLIHDYADLLKLFTDDIKTSLNNAQIEVNKRKNDYLFNKNDTISPSPIVQNTDINNINNSSSLLLPSLQQPKVTINPIISNPISNNSGKPDYSLFESKNNILLLEDTIQEQIIKLFIYLGGLVGKGIAQVGQGIVYLLELLDRGWKAFDSTILPTMKEKGLLGMLDDPDCQEILMTGIMWGTIILGIIWTARYILRKVTAILSWLSGYEEENYRRRR